MASDESGSGDESEGDSRIVIANGRDVDKRYFYEVNKKMAKDWDLRKLAYLGPPLWVGLSLVVVAATVWRYVPTSLVPTSLPSAGVGIFGRDGLLAVLAGHSFEIIVAVVVLGVFLIPVLSFSYDFVASLLAVGMDLVRLVARASRSLRPEVWQKSNYWNPFTTHLSGRDPLLVLTDGTDDAVTGLYNDSPHYGNVFVDSVYLSFDGDLTTRQRLLVWLYDYRWRWVRRGLVLGLFVVVLSHQEATVLGYDPLSWLDGIAAATADYYLVSAVLLAVLLALHVATLFPVFFATFLAESAGLSRYNQLLNEDGADMPTRNDGRVGLSNSMSGYGLFYVSEFLYQQFGYRDFEVSFGEAVLDDGDDADPFAPEGPGTPTADHAAAAAREVLWSAVPGDSVASGKESSDVAVRITGVDYYTTEDRYVSWLKRLWHGYVRSDEDEDGEDREDDDPDEEAYLVTESAGVRSGIRIPVKKFVSVPHEFDGERVRDAPAEYPELYSFDGDDGSEPLRWDEDTLHYVLLGGGEHQQGINKLVLSLKARGYENVDVLENAFASATVVDDAEDDPRSVWTRSLHPDPPVDPDGIDAPAFFPTEYFVSGVFGTDSTELFRQRSESDDAFVLLRCPLADGETPGDASKVYHVVVGMSAAGTKVGFLYWLSQYEDGFPDIDPNTIYCIECPGYGGIDGVGDVGHLYLNSDWRDRPDAELQFDLTDLGASESATANDGEQADDARHDSDGSSEAATDSGSGKQLDIEFKSLDVTYDSARS